jgi:hypothetical protein
MVTMMRTLSGGWMGTEECVGVGLEQFGSLADLDSGLLRAWQRAVGAQQGIQHSVHGLDGIEDVALRAAERGETKNGELRLQLPDIMTAQRKIVGKIPGAAAVGFMKSQGAFEQRSFQFEHIGAKRGQFRGELFEQTLVQDSHGR